MWLTIIIGRLILGQGAVPLDFNGLSTYGPLGFFVIYLIYRQWKDDEQKEKMQQYMNEDRKEMMAKLDKATNVIERLEKLLDK